MSARKHSLAILSSGIVVLAVGLVLLGPGIVPTTIHAQNPGLQTAAPASPSANMGTAFTYQGRLSDSSGPVDSICNFRFTLYDAASGGGQVGGPLSRPGVTLDDGYFAVDLDFDAGVFQGEGRYMKIEVDCGSGFVALNPRVALHPAPYALALPGLWTQQNDTSPNLIGGYSGNEVAAGVKTATIGGGGMDGYPNRVTDDSGTVGGGGDNQAGDGPADPNNAGAATVGGGWGNTAGANLSTVAGGYNNLASGGVSSIGGGNSNVASGWGATVGGGAGNTASGHGAVIAGGGGWDEGTSSLITNTATADWSSIGGGRENNVNSLGSTIGGGEHNIAGGDGHSTIGGGAYNTIAGGGVVNTIGGGEHNTVSSEGWGTVGGGFLNTVSGSAATVPGGFMNKAEGLYSFAAGRKAHAIHDGTFVWADSNDDVFASNFADQFSVRSTAGARFALAIDGTGVPTWLCTVANGGSWACSTPLNRSDIQSVVDGAETLERLSQVPISTWSAKSQGATVRHIGPLAQDFYAAFGVGEDNQRIATIDLDGVALSAIQGLYAQNQSLQAENASLRSALDDLEARVAALEAER